MMGVEGRGAGVQAASGRGQREGSHIYPLLLPSLCKPSVSFLLFPPSSDATLGAGGSWRAGLWAAQVLSTRSGTNFLNAYDSMNMGHVSLNSIARSEQKVQTSTSVAESPHPGSHSLGRGHQLKKSL